MRIRNTFIIFIVSGFWHGANWTFIVWGILNALFIMPSIIMKTNRTNIEIVAKDRLFPTLKELSQMALTFALAVIAWIFFRAENIQHALNYLSEMFSSTLFTMPKFTGMRGVSATIISVLVFLLIEWAGRQEQYAIAKLGLTWKPG